jgi:hypothetical protein
MTKPRLRITTWDGSLDTVHEPPRRQPRRRRVILHGDPRTELTAAAEPERRGADAPLVLAPDCDCGGCFLIASARSAGTRSVRLSDLYQIPYQRRRELQLRPGQISDRDRWRLGLRLQ